MDVSLTLMFFLSFPLSLEIIKTYTEVRINNNKNLSRLYMQVQTEAMEGYGQAVARHLEGGAKQLRA